MHNALSEATKEFTMKIIRPNFGPFYPFVRSLRSRKSQKVLFDHIPKCGGSSLTHLLRLSYGHHRVAPPFMGEQASVAKRAFKNYDVVIGHLGGQIFDNWPQNLFCCTLVRDPLDRALSTYYYFQRLPNSGVPQVESVRALSLDEFSQSTRRPFVNEILNNPLTVHFAAAFGYTGDFRDVEAVWEAAVNGFNSYDVIGICEDHQKSSRAIFSALGISMPKIDYPSLHLNKNDKRKQLSDVPPHITEILERRNQYDIRLYKAAVERLNKRPYHHLLKTPDGVALGKPPSSAKVHQVEIKGEDSGNTFVKSGEAMTVLIRFSLSEDYEAFRYSFRVTNEEKETLFGFTGDDISGNPSLARGEHELLVRLTNPLKFGRYHIGISLTDIGGRYSNPFGVNVDFTSDIIASFEVMGNLGPAFFGTFKVPETSILIK